MGRSDALRKVTDYETVFSCAGGAGILREEVWVNTSDEVTRYNLALIVPHLLYADHGRMLGFDNAHGVHERHFMGAVEPVEFKNYEATAKRFFREAEQIRRKL